MRVRKKSEQETSGSLSNARRVQPKNARRSRESMQKSESGCLEVQNQTRAVTLLSIALLQVAAIHLEAKEEQAEGIETSKAMGKVRAPDEETRRARNCSTRTIIQSQTLLLSRREIIQTPKQSLLVTLFDSHGDQMAGGVLRTEEIEKIPTRVPAVNAAYSSSGLCLARLAKAQRT